MAGVVNLKPEVGTELSALLTDIMDKVMMDAVQAGYDAVRALGDDNNIVEDIKVKFGKFQDHYNGSMVPAANKVKTSMEQYTDFAEYVKNMQVDTSVKDVEVGTVKPNSYDAAKSL